MLLCFTLHEFLIQIAANLNLIIQFLGVEHEGLFRKAGVESRMRSLTQRLSEGRGIDVESDEMYSPNDIASLLKRYLSNLPDKMLGHNLYTSHLEVNG